jgi:hypothetical protein
LVLIGSVALAGCEPEPARPITRDLYASAADYEADWGRPANCERDDQPTTGGGSGGPRYYWRGPGYYDGERDSAQRSARGYADGANRSVGKATITGPAARGGFGSSAHSYGSSGG